MNSLPFRIVAILMILCGSILVRSASAQQYPNRPVHIIVGYAPGGSTDIAARVIGAQFQEALGQPFIIENRPGASAIVAHQYVAQANPDGYTLIISASGDTVNVSLKPDMPYNYLEAFTPIARLTQSPYIVVAPPQLAVKTLNDLFDVARNGKLNYGSSGAGTPSHLGAELMFLTKGIKVTHIPYDGAGPTSTAVMSGEVQLAFVNMSSSIALTKAGSMRALGQSGLTRSPLAPDVPTVAEAGLPGFNVVSWAGIDAPARTPADIVKRLSDASVAALAKPDVREQLMRVGQEPYPGTSAEYAAFLKGEVDQWAKVVKAAGVKPQ